MNRGAVPVPQSALLRYVIAALWLCAALAVLAAGRKKSALGFSAAAMAAALWEMLNAGALAGNLLRGLATAAGLYMDRHVPQQTMTVILIILLAAAILFILLCISARTEAVIWTALILCWGTSFAGVMSLHEVDSMLAAGIGGIQAGQALKFACAAACVCAALSVLLRKRSAMRRHGPEVGA